MAELQITCLHWELDRVSSLPVDDEGNAIGPVELISRCSCGNEVRTLKAGLKPGEHDRRVVYHESMPAAKLLIQGWAY